MMRLPYKALRYVSWQAQKVRRELISRSSVLTRMAAPHAPRDLALRRVFEPSDLKLVPNDVEKYLRREFTVLGKTVRFNGTIDWHADFNGGSWPALSAWDYGRFYRNDFSDPDYRKHGDIKRAWDFNKQLHFIDLAATYHITGDERCRSEIEYELSDWTRRNPYLRGIGWSAQLIVAQRAISWILAFNLDAVSDPLSGMLARSLYQHGVYLSQNLEESSTGLNSNHLIGDLAALFLIGKSLQQEAWIENSLRKLERELDAQIYDDGVHYEQSSGYHRYIEEFLFLVWLANGRSPNKLTEKLAQMSEFLRAIAWPDGSQPFLSDWDGAKVWVKDHHRPEELYPLARIEEGCKAFPKGGYYVIQHDSHKLVFDCGPIGMGNRQLATHGHSDLLSFTLAFFGEPILVDPGSGSYTENKEVHNYCRSTRGHNSLVLDGRDQCGLAQTWTLLKQPNAKVSEWRSSDMLAVVEGEHDGFAPIVHRRRIEFQMTKPSVIISDRLLGSGSHLMESYLHFSPHLQVSLDENSFSVQGNNSKVTIAYPENMKGTIEEGYFALDYGLVTRSKVGCLQQQANLPVNTEIRIDAVRTAGS